MITKKIEKLKKENITIKKQEVDELLKVWTLGVKKFNFDQKYLMKLKANFEELDLERNLWIFFDFKESGHNVLTYYPT